MPVRSPKARSAAAPSIVRFDNPHRPELEIEVLRFDELFAKAPKAYLASPQRPEFHSLLFADEAYLHHEVDFTRHTLRSGSVLGVAPGQVQCFTPRDGASGWLVLFSPQELHPSARDAFPTFDAPLALGSDAADVHWLIARIRKTASDEPSAAIARALTRNLLHALVWLIVARAKAHASSDGSRRISEVFEVFRKLVERGFAAGRNIEDYAQQSGYSTKTLSRATKAAVGMSAKQYVDGRVALEAKRLLVHTDASVARISHQLGFSEPTNFIKFFRRQTGMSPVTFKESAARRGSSRST